MSRFFIALLLLAAAPLARGQDPAPAAPSREANATLVIYNNLDPDSVQLARYYAKERSIPLDHVTGLDCPLNEEISRADYDLTIAEPLRKLFALRGWWREPAEPHTPILENHIRYVALMRGIPLKISSATAYPGDSYAGHQKELSTNAAAVDSELATLGIRTNRISGEILNPYYRCFTPFMDCPLPPIMLVCRLDAPTPQIVRNMIDGALAAEQRGLTGFAYIDLRGINDGPLSEGDKWLATAAADLRKSGMPVVWDSSPDQFPVEFPMAHAAYYLGWYSSDVAGPISRNDFRFLPGAVAVHIHSYSANSLRNAAGGWAAPLLAHGAAATMGNVYEPYLSLTPNLDIFTDRLRNGFNFAESAYASERVLSWMTTFVGDPLYRPFGALEESAAESRAGDAKEYAAYREGAHTWYQTGRAAGEKRLMASARSLRSGIVWEGLGLLQWSVPDSAAASTSFEMAQKCYGKTEDGLRTVLHRVQILKAAGQPGGASALAGKELAKFAGVQGVTLLRSMAFPSAAASDHAAFPR